MCIATNDDAWTAEERTSWWMKRQIQRIKRDDYRKHLQDLMEVAKVVKILERRNKPSFSLPALWYQTQCRVSINSLQSPPIVSNNLIQKRPMISIRASDDLNPLHLIIDLLYGRSLTIVSLLLQPQTTRWKKNNQMSRSRRKLPLWEALSMRSCVETIFYFCGIEIFVGRNLMSAGVSKPNVRACVTWHPGNPKKP